MKKNKSNNLPKTATEITNGGLYHQRVRCGKSNCRCASGDLHEGFFYYIRQVNGRQRKTYVPKLQIDQISKLINQSRATRRHERQLRVRTGNLLSELRRNLRGYESVIRSMAEALKENG